MKKLKVFCSLFGVGALCCMGLMTDVNAAVVYDVGDVSETHTYKSASQYYTINGLVTVINGNRNLGNVTYTWTQKGSATFSQGSIVVVKKTENYILNKADSKIKIGGVTNTRSLQCKLDW